MSSTSEKRIPELDGFRGAAVLAIVLLHYFVHHVSAAPGSLLAYSQKYLMFLWVGVDAFFVLSGYLIGGILLQQRDAVNYYKVFYVRRALRIVPPYLLLLAAWLIARGRLAGPPYDWLLDPDSAPAWVYFMYLQNFWMAARETIGPMFVAVTWSLAIEEQFYLLAPFLVRWLRPRRTAWVLLAGIVFAVALRGFMASRGDSSDALLRLLFSRWDSLLVGVAAAWAIRNEDIRKRLLDGRRKMLACCGLLFLLMLCMPLILDLPGALQSPLKVAFGFLVIALFFAVLLVLLSLGALPRVTGALSMPWLRGLGRVSYFVYLFHTAALGLAFAFVLGKHPELEGWADWMVVLVALVVTMALAELSWRFLEAPLVAKGHRLRYRSGS